MKYIMFQSMKYHTLKIVNLNKADEFGYKENNNKLYVSYKGIHSTVFECDKYGLTPEEGYQLCAKAFKEYIDKSNTMADAIHIDIDKLVESIIATRKINIEG